MQETVKSCIQLYETTKEIKKGAEDKAMTEELK